MAKTTNGIVYPSDYSAVADIPNDLKCMAESIDKLLNKYSLVTESGNQIRLVFNDTTNKFKAILNDKNGNKLSESDEIDLGINVMITDIAYNDKKLIITLKNGEIKSVSISSLIDGLVKEDDFNKLSDKNVVIENELTELASQMPWNTTEISKSIHIEDSAKYSRNKLDVFGDLVQEKREGINLLPSGVETNITKNGVTFTCNGKGKYTVNGTATKDTFIYIDLKKSVTLPTNETLYLHIRNNASNILIFGIPESDNYTPSCSEINRITTLTKLNSGNKITKIYLKVIEGNTSNIELQPSIELSGDDTNFEQYGAMPSIEYPSMPQVVTGVQKITEIGKNYLNIPDAEFEQSGVSVKIKNNRITFNGTAKTGFSLELATNLEMFLKGVHTFSVNVVSGSSSGVFRFYLRENINVNLLYSPLTFISTTNSATNEVDTIINNLGIYINKGNSFDNYTIELQVEKNDVATSYEYPKEKEIFELDLGDTELCKITDENGNVVAQDRIVYKDGKWQFEKNVRKIILNGNQTWIKSSYSDDVYLCAYLQNPASNATLKYMVNDKLQIGDYVYVLDKEVIKNDKQLNLRILASRLAENSVQGLSDYLGSNPITIYSPVINIIYEDCTAEQSEVLDKLYKLSLQKGTNNIFVDSENGLTVDLQLTYMQDNNLLKEQEYKTLEDRITTLEELLSTTQTSAMLLDNMQSDLESEV